MPCLYGAGIELGNFRLCRQNLIPSFPYLLLRKCRSILSLIMAVRINLLL